jgi:tRNA pseudouridine65 synthase
MHTELCVCAHVPRLDLRTRLALVIHNSEQHKPTATGPLAAEVLVNSEVLLHGVRDAPLDLQRLHDEGRRVLLLFPSEGARELSTSLRDEDPRPITLVVPDGNWRQASRIPKRVLGLASAQHVTLPPGPPSQWGVRRETRAAGLATFEAIARAFGILESASVQQELEALFVRMVDATFAARGHPTAGSMVDDAGGEGAQQELSVLYRDEHLIAVNKPSGVLVHRGWARDGVPALQQLRDQIGQFVYPVHRLDRATSGALLFALSSEAARDTQALFKREQVEKRYLAVCRGNDPTLRSVDHPLAQKDGGEKRPAFTELRLLGTFERYGLFEARPRTGRTHQIRRHLKKAAHPIIGDVRYGKGEHNRLFRGRFGFHRLALHCHRLAFDHPRTAERVEIEAPLSDDLVALLAQLGLADAL